MSHRRSRCEGTVRHSACSCNDGDMAELCNTSNTLQVCGVTLIYIISCNIKSRPVTSPQYLTQAPKCRIPPTNQTRVLIGVLSGVVNFERRAAIRDTWGGTAVKMGFHVVFLLGKTADQEVQRKVLVEHRTYDDIVQGDLVDSYENLTYKTVMLVRWAHENCPGIDFVLKIDDDMLLGVWDLAVVVNGLVGIKRITDQIATMRPSGTSSKEQYAPDNYPVFLSGTGYLISGDAVSLLEAATREECFFHLEDIYLTAIVAERAQVRRLALDGFSNEHKPYYRPCSTPRLVTSHEWSPTALKREWQLAVSRLNVGLCVGINQNQIVT
ncbi:hypothetical protein HPB50_024451 [Hyalomma asiaticum]|uniref:Uncharacterized protein n=1 Tax=Hyalomma asiaticum TaxID=266040 RepID=A0ACB7T4T7_HYAAI|nr:hypothetical protein HPB50_024451 [Hyalomma asiaticum]